MCGGGSPELRARQSHSPSCAGWALHASSTRTRRVGAKCRERTKVQCGPTARFVSRRSPCKKKRVLKTNVQLLLILGGKVALFRRVVQVTVNTPTSVEEGWESAWLGAQTYQAP